MENKLGIIAGSGEFPRLVVEEAKKLGYKCAVAAIEGEAEASILEEVDLRWFGIEDIQNIISFFNALGVSEAVLAGKIDHRIIYNFDDFSLASFPFLDKNKPRSPTALLKAIIDYLEQKGIKIKSPFFLLSSLVCKEGILTVTKPSPLIEEDVAFGWKMAKKIADWDIGQTLVVKDKAVVAVEGMEGTDRTIKRAGLLAGPGTVVVKAARTRQDARVDLPAVGLKTLEVMVEVGSRALCFEAEIMPFFQKEAAIKLADVNHISIIAKK